MMNPKVMQRLMWKDARTLAPLVIATLAAIIGLNVLSYLIIESMGNVDARERLEVSKMLWILLPNLLAFGAPAMLVGGEEESGSLAWLRTLPASWRLVSLSKLVVSLSALAVAWFLGSLLYVAQWGLMPTHVAMWAESTGSNPDWSLAAVLSQLGFSAALLLTSFVMAYWLRSPINALLAVLPAMAALVMAFLGVEEYWRQRIGSQERWETVHPTLLWLSVSIPTLVSFLALVALHQWSARRRLSGPEEGLRRRIELSISSDAFRPPSPMPNSWYGVSLVHRRPTRAQALLWQTSRQSLGTLLSLTLIGVIGVAFAVMSRGDAELGGSLASVAVLGLAGLTFYGDSVRNRCAFLADRGVSHSLVWRTRLMPTLGAVAFIVALMLLGSLFVRVRSDDRFLFVTSIAVGYALGQLVSQWAPRPVLAFLAAPVYALLAFAIFAPLYNYYRSGALFALWVTVPLLLFASWSLMPRWLSGSKGRAYTWRMAGYLAIGIVLPYALVLGVRAATIPTASAAWRSQMLAFELPSRDSDQPRVEIYRAAFLEDEIFYAPYARDFCLSPERRESFSDRLVDEMESTDSIGQFVSFNEIVARTNYCPPRYENTRNLVFYHTVGLDPREESLRMSELLLKWSAMVRRQARVGEATFVQLAQISERAESIAASLLEQQLNQTGVTEEIRELVHLFPDESLVLESRRNSLIKDWQKYHASDRDWHGFVGTPVQSRPALFSSLEQLRMDRYVDQTVRLAEQHWKSGSSADLREVPGFMKSAIQANMTGPMEPLINSGTQDRIERLRNRVKTGGT